MDFLTLGLIGYGARTSSAKGINSSAYQMERSGKKGFAGSTIKDWSVFFVRACGVLIIGLGGMVIFGWYTNWVMLIEIYPGYAPMQYLTALGFILSGLALVSFTFRLRRFVMACGLITGCAGLLIIIEYIFKIKLGFDVILEYLPVLTGYPPLRPSPPTALCFTFCGAAFIALGSSVSPAIRRPIIWIFGSFTLALCLMAIAGYFTGLTGTYAWGQFVGMAIHTAAGISVLSLGLLGTQALEVHGPPLTNDPWLPMPIGVAMLTATVILWQALLTDQYKRQETASAAMVRNLKADIVTVANARFQVITRMERRWNWRGGIPFEEWKEDVNEYLKDEKGLIAVEWVDATMQVRWILPEKDAAEMTGQSILKDASPQIAEFLKNASGKQTLIMSPSVPLKQNGRGFYIYLPLFAKDRFDGFIVGVFSINDFLSSVFSSEDITNYSLSVFEGENLIYGFPPRPRNSGRRLRAETKIEIFGHHWRLTGIPTPEYLAKTTSHLPYLVLLLGIILSGVLTLAVHALQRMKQQTRAVAIANRKLQQEISERKGIEAKLRESEERLRMVLDSAIGVSVIATDLNGIITFFSTGSERLLGYSAEEMVGKVTPAVFHDGEEMKVRGEELSKEFGRVIEGFEVFTTRPRIDGNERREWIYICKDGSRKTVELTTAVAHDAAQNITGYLGTAVDMTERNQTRALLEERNRQLEIATARAEAHAKAKTEFLANMSHEIRTPLNAIIGMSEMLHDVAADSRQLEFVDTIRTSGDALLGLINNILDFSKIEAGQLDMEHIPVDLHECVESALDLVSTQAASKKLDLLYWIEPSVPAFILGDVTRLRQVLVNLVANGVKFTEKGEVFVRISKVKRKEGSAVLHVSIHDTGIGIPLDRQDRLFHAFSQVDASTTRRFGGTGLGLAICHRLINLMKGRLWVDSPPGGGTDFQFEIPLESAEVSTPRIYQRGASHELDGMRVLIVDDNETNRWILQTQTAGWNMQSRATSQPSEALQWIERGDPFDLAILDAHMPEMNGYELASKLRGHHTSRKMPILILTSMRDQAQDLEKLGIDAILTKPVKTGALFDTVGQLLLGRRILRQQTQAKGEHAMFDECPLKILVAEDNPVNQRVTTLLLERMGYRPEVVANGLEVLAAVARSKFDIILLDVQMPEMDGLEAARELSHLYSREERPYIIALTADAAQSDREECLAAGMNDYLSKPVRSNKLAEVLRTAFAERAKGNSSKS